MHINLQSIFAFTLIVTLLASCCNNPKDIDQSAELIEIENTISSCIGWFKDKDFDLVYSVVANDENYISVHPTDKVVFGYDEFVKNSEIFKREEFQYVRHELKDLHINISKSGDVAWWYCILDDINTWDGHPANWENARWTGTLEKRDGTWVIVQQHFSFAD